MTTFKATRRELTIELAVKTTARLESFRGTKFVPNHCEARVVGGQIVSVTLERMEDNGVWIAEDPAVDGAELSVSYGGGELAADYREKLPKVAQDALAEIEKAAR